MIIDCIERAKVILIENNVSPPFTIYLSPLAHLALVQEMAKRSDKGKTRDTRIFEIQGMKVELDPLCPDQGAYIQGSYMGRRVL